MRKHIIKIFILMLAIISISLSACSTNSSITTSGTGVSSESQTVISEVPTSIALDTDASSESQTTSTEVSTTIASEITQASSEQSSAPSESLKNDEVTGELKVTYLDVGQADCILIQNGSSTMLIDAGNNGDADTVVNYIKQHICIGFYI